MTSPTLAKHRADGPSDDHDCSQCDGTIPDTVRIGGVQLMTAARYEQLRHDVRDADRGWARRRAARRLKAENRRRTVAIRRVVEQGGFDVEGKDPGHRGAVSYTHLTLPTSDLV